MRGRIITAVAMGLGLCAAVPSMAQAGRAPQREVATRTVTTRETRTVTQQSRPVQAVHRNVQPVVRRDDHVNVVRDVHVDEHVTINDRRPGWDHDRVQFIPTPVVAVPVTVAVNTDCDTQLALNQVPPVVLNAVAQQTGGAPIVGVDYVRQGAGIFYDVRISGPYNALQTLRFGINGGFYGYL